MGGNDVRTDVRRLRRSSALAGLGEGLVAVVLPLLAASLTRDPLAVAAVFATQHLAWFLAAAVGGRLAGAVDRRTTVGAVNTLRAAALGVLGYLVLNGDQTLVHLHAVAFLVGLGEVLGDDGELAAADTLAATEAPATVGATFGARAMFLVAGGFLVGGATYEAYSPVPLLLDVAVFSLAALAALSVRRILGPSRAAVPASALGALTEARASLAGSGQLPVAVAALAAAAWGAVLGVLVLFALVDLGLEGRSYNAVLFGGLLAALAAATALGALLAPEVGRVLGLRIGLVAALAVAGAGQAAAGALADPARPYAAVAALVVAATATTAAVVLVRAAFHTATGRPPTRAALRAFQLASWGAVPVGALVGGAAARTLGVGGLVTAAGAATVAVGLLAAAIRPAAAPKAERADDGRVTRPVSPA